MQNNNQSPLTQEDRELLENWRKDLNEHSFYYDLSADYVIDMIDNLLAAKGHEADERVAAVKKEAPLCIFNSCNDCQILAKRYKEQNNHDVVLSGKILNPESPELN